MFCPYERRSACVLCKTRLTFTEDCASDAAGRGKAGNERIRLRLLPPCHAMADRPAQQRAQLLPISIWQGSHPPGSSGVLLVVWDGWLTRFCGAVPTGRGQAALGRSHSQSETAPNLGPRLQPCSDVRTRYIRTSVSSNRERAGHRDRQVGQVIHGPSTRRARWIMVIITIGDSPAPALVRSGCIPGRRPSQIGGCSTCATAPRGRVTITFPQSSSLA